MLYFVCTVTRFGGKQSVNRNRSTTEIDAVQADHGVFQCLGQYGDVVALDGSGEPLNDDRRPPHRVRPLVHIELYFHVRDDQGSIHAESIGSAGVRVLAIVDPQ